MNHKIELSAFLFVTTFLEGLFSTTSSSDVRWMVNGDSEMYDDGERKDNGEVNDDGEQEESSSGACRGVLGLNLLVGGMLGRFFTSLVGRSGTVK